MLTIITPIFCQSKNDYIYNRSLFFINNSYTSDKIKRIVVDFGSIDNVSEELEFLCNKNNISYYNMKRNGNPFSAGECRNFGVSKSTTDYITFQDIDLYAPSSTYNSLIERISSTKFYNEVECIPCLYLNEELSEDYIKEPSWEESHKIAYNLYKEKNSAIKMYAPVTSMIIIRRNYYLENGGNNTEFHGHGYEDFELLNRLANRSNKFVRSRDYYNHDFKYDSPHYSGYRTFFSLFGREAMNDKLFFVHLWHPENINKNYSSRNRINREIFEKLIRKFDNENYLPAPLSGNNKYFEGNTLILSPFNGKTSNTIRTAIPFLSSCFYIKDDEIMSNEDFFNYIKKNNIKRVLFFNAYANDHRLSLYRYCIENDIKTINYDRGGLPDTWFFDPHGFNSSSKSYSDENWDHEITIDEHTKVKEYILKTLCSENALEKNGNRIGAHNLKNKYNIRDNKILFVPLQRPNDSVIKHFSDRIGSVENFFSELIVLAKSEELKDWKIIIKNHPLEPNDIFNSKQFPSNIILLSNKDHFCDAVLASDAVMLINSGVGLYSLMAGKPTFNVGNAYYSHTHMSVKIDSPLSFIDYIYKLTPPSNVRVERFIHFLINKFYSFGTTNYIENVDAKSKRRTNVALYTDFVTLRLPLDNGETKTFTLERRTNPYKINSSYYDFYRSGILLREKIKPVVSVNTTTSTTLIKKEINPTTPNIIELKKTTITPLSLPAAKKRLNKKLIKLVKRPRLFFKDALNNSRNRKTSA